jgi:hypothetical protein
MHTTTTSTRIMLKPQDRAYPSYTTEIIEELKSYKNSKLKK